MNLYPWSTQYSRRVDDRVEMDEAIIEAKGEGVRRGKKSVCAKCGFARSAGVCGL